MKSYLQRGGEAFFDIAQLPARFELARANIRFAKFQPELDALVGDQGSHGIEKKEPGLRHLDRYSLTCRLVRAASGPPPATASRILAMQPSTLLWW